MTKQTGFTLIELTVITALIGILAIIFIVGYRGSEKRFSLHRSLHKLAQDLRTCEEMALSSQKFDQAFPLGGYGIYFTTSTEKYILFADCDAEKDYDQTGTALKCEQAEQGPGLSIDEFVKELSLEPSIEVVELQVNSVPVETLTITFIPPDPTVIINANVLNNSATIFLSFENGVPQKVSINKLGQIEIK